MKSILLSPASIFSSFFHFISSHFPIFDVRIFHFLSLFPHSHASFISSFSRWRKSSLSPAFTIYCYENELPIRPYAFVLTTIIDHHHHLLHSKSQQLSQPIITINLVFFFIFLHNNQFSYWFGVGMWVFSSLLLILSSGILSSSSWTL